MIKTFKVGFRLKITYRVNAIIYYLKQIPLIKRFISHKLYRSKGLKIFGYIMSILIEIGKIFLGKLLYFIFMIYLPSKYFLEKGTDSFTHILLFLTIIGMFFNTKMLSSSKEIYYAIFLMRLKAKEYVLSSYFYELFRIIAGFTLCSFLFGRGIVSSKVVWIIPLFVAGCKSVVSAFSILMYQRKKGKNKKGKIFQVWIILIIIVACLYAAYALPALYIAINEDVFFVIALIMTVLGLFANYYMIKFNDYRTFYKQAFLENEASMADAKKAVQEGSLKNIETDTSISSTKKGFEYLNDLFIKRHRKILMKPIKMMTVIVVGIIVVLLIGAYFNQEVAAGINKFLHFNLSWFLIIMYSINRTQLLTQAMFMSCDHSLLTYPFYKKPKHILALFAIRLRDIIRINLIPAGAISIGLPILLYVTGGTKTGYLYFLLFISILAINVFFSVHHLVMYYLLQPYNAQIEMKSTLYTVVNVLTYFISYQFIQIKASTIMLSSIFVGISIAYCVVALFLIYKFAHKTFKLRL